MATAVSFTSESSDRYLSLITHLEDPDLIAEELELDYGDEFAYLHIDAIMSSTTPVESIRNALTKRLEIAREGF